MVTHSPLSKLDRQALNQAVDAFEEAWNNADGEPPKLTDFLPADVDVDGHHEHLETLAVELLCVDFERRWHLDEQTRIDRYEEVTPKLWANPKIRSQLAFEQYRLIEAARDPASESPQVGASHETSDDAEDLRGAYAKRYRVDTDHWHDLTETVHETKFAETHPADWQAELPQVGEVYERFEIVERLAPCHNGAVYLAKQPDLADRIVVLKVTDDHWQESDRLARLQHTNIVPIHSVHHFGRWQTVCMPYMGRATLHHVLEQLRKSKTQFATLTIEHFLDVVRSANSDLADAEQPSAWIAGSPSDRYEDCVLKIFVRLLRGLGHAHDRGLLHRDIKPANILMTASGEPLLFDFNLSKELRSLPQPKSDGVGRSSRSMAGDCVVGGTIGYMSPEQRSEYDGKPAVVDERSDIYSLGLVLFETLTGERAIDMTRSRVGAEAGAADRLSARQHSPDLSPAVDAILNRCLAKKPSNRYRSAAELREDLQRHLANLPLRHAANQSLRERFTKWIRRHPRLTSATAITSLAVVFVVAAIGIALVRGRQVATYQAHVAWQRFELLNDSARAPLVVPWSDPIGIESGLSEVERALAIFGRVDQRNQQQMRWIQFLSEKQRQRLLSAHSELHYLAADALLRHAEASPDTAQHDYEQALEHNRLAIVNARPEPDESLFVQQADLASRVGNKKLAQKSVARTNSKSDASPRRHSPVRLMNAGRYSEALPQLLSEREAAPKDFFTTFLIGICYYQLENNQDAVEELSRASGLWPDSHLPYFVRGLVYLETYPEQAEDDFTEALKRYPKAASIYHNRALARRTMAHWKGVVEDLTTAIEQFGARPSWLSVRADAYEQLEKSEEAKQDRARIRKTECVTPEDYCIVAAAELDTSHSAANKVLEEGLARFPNSIRLLHNRVYVLADRLDQLASAIELLDAAIERQPNLIDSRLLRVELLVTANRRTDALVAADELLSLDSSPKTLFHVGRLLVALGRDDPELQREGLKLVREAIRLDGDWAEFAKQDPTLGKLLSQNPD